MSQSFFARRSYTILLIATFLMPFLMRGTRLTLESNQNDVKDWLPSHFEETQIHQWFQGHFPHEQFVLISWEGCTLDDPRLELFARKLEDFNPNLQQLGISGKSAKALTAAGLTNLRAIEKILEQNHGKLVAVEGLQPKQAEDVVETIRRWVPPFKQPVLTGERLVKMLAERHEDLTEEEVLNRLEGSLIGRDHDKTCLVVTLSEAAKGKHLRQTLNTIREIADRDCEIPPQDIRLGGPPVDNVAIAVEGERTLYRLAALSGIVGLLISWLCFRSFRLTFLVFFIGILAAGIGLSSVYWSGTLARLLGIEWFANTYGTCDAILLTMPSLVYVLGLSGAIHIVNYYHDAVREFGLDRAPERALGHAMLPCTLASLTTALGLGSLLASHLVPVSKFGIFSAWGVLATLALLFLYLPACLHFFPSRNMVRPPSTGSRNPEEKSAIVKFWHAVGEVIIRHNGWVTVGCLAVMAVFGMGLFKMETSVKLMKMFSSEAEIVGHYEWLEKHIGPLVPMEVVVKIDNERCPLNMVQRMRLARDVEEAIESLLEEHAREEKLDNVGSALSAATFAPDIGPTPRSAERRLGWSVRDSATSRALDKFRKEFRTYLAYDGDATLAELGITGKIADRLNAKQWTTAKALETHHDELAAIRGIGPEGAQQIDEAIDKWRIEHGIELWRVSARVWALTDLDYSQFVQDLRERVEHVVDQRYRVLSEEDRAAGVKPVEGIEIVYTGLVPLVYKAQHELMAGLTDSLMWAFGLIAVVMIVVLRSPAAGLLAMLPNVFPVVVVFGAMGTLGILIDVGTMMTASVALGVAVDDTIHFLTWFRQGLDDGLDRKGAVMMAYERCGTAMTQTTLIGGFGLSVFAFSTFTPTQRFGALMLALLFAALVGDLIFLPAVLSGPIGRFFRTSKKRKPRHPSSNDTATADSQSEESDEVAADSDDELVTVPIDGSVPRPKAVGRHRRPTSSPVG